MPAEEGSLILPPMDRDGVLLAELFKTCDGRFDAVLCPAAYLDSVNWLLEGRTPSVSVETTEPRGIPSRMIRRGDALEPVYVSAHVYTDLQAAILVRDMYGSGTLPHLVERVRHHRSKYS